MSSILTIKYAAIEIETETGWNRLFSNFGVATGVQFRRHISEFEKKKGEKNERFKEFLAEFFFFKINGINFSSVKEDKPNK